MAWYETKTCAVCGKTIGRRRFWQQGPRLVGPGHDVRYGDHLTEAEVEALLASHCVACASCFYDRLNEVMAVAEETKPCSPGTSRRARSDRAAPPLEIGGSRV